MTKTKTGSLIEGDILIVNHIKANFELLVEILRNGGFDVYSANNAESALRSINTKQPALILIDVKLSGVDGFEMSRRLKADEKTNAIPIIFISALEDESSKIKGFQAGCVDFINKPFHAAEVLARVKTHLGLRKMRLELERQNERLRNEISERKQAEEELTFRNIILSTQQEVSIDGILVVDENNTIISYNRRFVEIMGIPPDMVESRFDEPVLQFVTELMANPQEFLKRVQYIYKHKRYTSHEEIVLKDGRIIDRYSSPMFGTDDRYYGRVWYFRDITQRKQAEEALRESEERLRITMEVTQTAIWDWDLKNDRWYASSLYYTMLGYEPVNEFSDRSVWLARVHPDDLASVTAKINDVLAGIGSEYIYEARMRHTNGTYRWHRVTGFVVERNKNGKATRMLGTRVDITERKLAEAELIAAKEKAEESDRLKTAFLQNISHEIRTPMNAIAGFSDLLSHPRLQPEKREYFIDIIVQSSNQLLSVITDIISIATIEAGQEKIYENEVNLNSTLKFLHEQFIFKAQKKNISLSYKTLLPDNEANIITDRTKLNRILTYLIDNALKFTKQGYIHFAYKIDGNYLEFYVEDTGIGIPSEMYNEIFKRFCQVESSTTRQFGGSGLGLSISKAYVELFGGKIWLHSEPGKGSVFYFTIPYKKVNSNVLENKQLTHGLSIEFNKSKTLLIAEDEDSNYLLLEELLFGMELNIIRAVNGAEAVKICKSNPHIDLVLMDIKMPGMDGYEATKQIKELKPGLPVIALTAYSTDIDKNKAFACGCSDFISKPFKSELLLSKIKRQLLE